MHPMYPIGPDGAGMFFGLTEQKLDAAELSDALIRAINKKDVDGARALFDHAFWHKVAFKPDWFHLYQAVERQDRNMVKLLTTYGATWTEDQAKILTVSLAEKLEGLTGVLHAAGIRTDYKQQDIMRMDILPALQMNKRIIDENKKNGVNTTAEEKKFSHAAHVVVANAVMRNDMEEAKQILAVHPDAENPAGHDVSDIFVEVLGDFLQSSSTRALTFVDRLREAGIKLQPIQFDKVPSIIIDKHYDLLPALKSRGLLQKDQMKLRDRLLDSWPFVQSRIDLDGYLFQMSEAQRLQKQALYSTAAKTLCTATSDISRDVVHKLLRQHATRMDKLPEGIARMDEGLLESGFFNNPAFTVTDLKTLADTTGLDAGIARQFNRLAARQEVKDKTIASLLHPKRFDTLLQAIDCGVLTPDAEETEQIVDYLHRRMKKEIPAPEAIAALKILKKEEADFYRVQRRDYLGQSKPGMAKALLDLDIITPHNINRIRLQKRCGTSSSLGYALFGETNDKHHPMREFLHQVELEKIAPDTYKPMRGKEGISYQRLYSVMRLKQVSEQMRRIVQTDTRDPRADAIRRHLQERHAAREKDAKNRQEAIRRILKERSTSSAAGQDTLRRILQEHARKNSLSAEQREVLKQIFEQRKKPPKPPKPPKPRFGY